MAETRCNLISILIQVLIWIEANQESSSLNAMSPLRKNISLNSFFDESITVNELCLTIPQAKWINIHRNSFERHYPDSNRGPVASQATALTTWVRMPHKKYHSLMVPKERNPRVRDMRGAIESGPIKGPLLYFKKQSFSLELYADSSSSSAARDPSGSL